MTVSGSSWLPLSLLAAERDPFQPVEDPATGRPQWRYGEADGMSWLDGVSQDRNGKWRRVRMDEQLPTGWRVSRLTAGELDIVVFRDVNRQRGAGNVKETT
ncbi:DUF2531 family protein [Klebsiella pneumoniae]|nr:DUF2531 family protein [Klebsiella pneumoniae]